VEGLPLPTQYSQLGLFVDDEGIIRIRGRLFAARNLPRNIAQPAFIEKETPLAEALVMSTHDEILEHVGG